MARNVIVDTGFLVALLRQRDSYHDWAEALANQHPPPWNSCESVVSETFHLIDARGVAAFSALLRRRAVVIAFDLGEDLEPVLTLMRKYADVPMDLADACLVRMTETRADPIVLTTDGDFRDRKSTRLNSSHRL